MHFFCFSIEFCVRDSAPDSDLIYGKIGANLLEVLEKLAIQILTSIPGTRLSSSTLGLSGSTSFA